MGSLFIFHVAALIKCKIFMGFTHANTMNFHGKKSWTIHMVQTSNNLNGTREQNIKNACTCKNQILRVLSESVAIELLDDRQ